LRRYYQIAPRLIEKIKRRPDADARLVEIREEWLKPALTAVGKGQNEAAHQIYRGMVENLEAELASGNPSEMTGVAAPTRTARDSAPATNPGHAQFASEKSDLLNGRPVVNFGMGWR
jgi:hypothetical protein